MLTREELAAMLKTVNVEDVARRADVSVKTVYRLRSVPKDPDRLSPRLATVHALIAAVDAIRAEQLTA